MGNKIEKLQFDSPYRTGAIATTDLHAGGVLFFYVYYSYLQFSSDGKVRFWRELIDNSGPFSEKEALSYKVIEEAEFSINDRGYLSFDISGAKYTGFTCNEAYNHIVFNVYFRKTGRSNSLVFKLENNA
jgi:hypothetical protein